jgi:hypothetical protein
VPIAEKEIKRMRRSVISKMRNFGSDLPPPAAVRFKPLAASMMPAHLPESYVPFPLPRYDTDLGFGPTRLENIPDVERAALRMAKTAIGERQLPPFGAVAEADSSSATLTSISDEKTSALDATPKKDTPPTPTKMEGSRAGVPGYVPDEYGAPLVERLKCVIPLRDLLHRLRTRTADHEFAATLVDISSQVPSYTAEEMVEAISAVHNVFDVTRGMKAFHRKHLRVQFSGRPFDTPNFEMLNAVFGFVEAVEGRLCVASYSDMFLTHHAVVIEMLHFMSVIKIFRPVEWYSVRESGDCRLGDYSHPVGNIGKYTAHKNFGWEFFDVLSVTAAENRGDFLNRASVEELVEILAGFIAVLSAEFVPGDVSSAIMGRIAHVVRQQDQANMEIQKNADDVDGCQKEANLVEETVRNETQRRRDALVSRVFFLSQMLYMTNVPRNLLELFQTIRFPTADFFSAHHGNIDVALVERFCTALSLARNEEGPGSKGASEDGGSSVAALLEAGQQLVMRIKDLSLATSTAARLQLDRELLCLIPIAARYVDAQDEIETKCLSQISPLVGSPVVTEATSAASQLDGEQKKANGVKSNKKKSWDPKTVLASTAVLETMDSILVFHSSIVKTVFVTAQLVRAIRACRSGATALIVTASSLQALHCRSLLTSSAAERRALDNALLTLTNEIYHRRVVFLPFSEELQFREVGTFFDEDSIVWSVGVRLAAKFAKPKCRALMDLHSKAALAHRFHRKSGVNPAEMDHDAQSLSFYTSSGSFGGGPLGSAVMHSPAALRAFRPLHHTQTAVRDRVFTDHVSPKKRRFLFRPDIGIMDKYRTVHRHLRPGFASGRGDHDFRGLGLHTPNFPQPSFEGSSE